jgi:enoyl-CoA hydratase/carnithine racemase
VQKIMIAEDALGYKMADRHHGKTGPARHPQGRPGQATLRRARMSDLLKFEIADGVATITLNRPEKMNAFTGEMMEDWLAALEDCRTNPEVRAIVMTGTGRAFTTGGDIEGFGASAAARRKASASTWIGGSQRLIRKIAEIDKPVIAALNGFATGGGLDIALACDIRFAAESARFAETYAKMGLIPGMGGAYLLPRIVGVAKALELFWSTTGWTRAKPSASAWSTRCSRTPN